MQHFVDGAVRIGRLDAEVVVAPAVVVTVAQLLDFVRGVGLVVAALADHHIGKNRPVLDLAGREHRDSPGTFAQADDHALKTWHPRPKARRLDGLSERPEYRGIADSHLRLGQVERGSLTADADQRHRSRLGNAPCVGTLSPDFARYPVLQVLLPCAVQHAPNESAMLPPSKLAEVVAGRRDDVE